MLVNSKPVSMEIDTGASISLINHETFVKLHGNRTRINPTSSRIRTYTGEIVKPKGSMEVQVECNGQKTRRKIIVVDGNCSNLSGRNILRKIKLNQNELFNTNQVKEYIVDDLKLNNVLLQQKNVFNSELGTLKNVEVKLKTKPGAIPKFCKAHPLPYVLVDQVETEFDRLVNEIIFEPFAHSDWAAHIVPVIKPDSSIRNKT